DTIPARSRSCHTIPAGSWHSSQPKLFARDRFRSNYRSGPTSNHTHLGRRSSPVPSLNYIPDRTPLSSPLGPHIPTPIQSATDTHNWWESAPPLAPAVSAAHNNWSHHTNSPSPPDESGHRNIHGRT